MKRIHVLSQFIANQIAAGEVVERPASVVKELIENAIDAGATAITIETKGGGLDAIRIVDNGSGILSDDVETAFLPHATSKISSAEDLSRIDTLGFRGEALASIAAVSRVTLKTRTAGEEAGTILRVNGGEIQEKTAAGLPIGTTIEVENLFYNIPARLKFVKSARAESAYISDYVSRMILAQPGVAFKLIQNGKTVYQSQGDGELKNALYCVYGAEPFPHLRELSYDDGYLRLSGFVGTEQAARSNRNGQSFFINGRYIKSQRLSFALQRAYDMRLMTGRFPLAVLHIAIASKEIDVNVHPNKLDVRFREEERVLRAATVATRKALGDPVAAREAYFTGGYSAEKREEQPAQRAFDEAEPRITHYAPRPSESVRETRGVEPLSAIFSPPAAAREKQLLREGPYMPALQGGAIVPPPIEPLPAEPPEVTGSPAVPAQERAEQTALVSGAYRIVGQAFDCYWIVQQGDAVFFIDQHAAHERRLYEQIAKKGVAAQSQLLLIPTIVRLSPADYDTLMENLPQFEELGFEIEEFGMLTVSVRAVPYLIGQPQTQAFLLEAIAQLNRKNRLSTVELKRAALIQTACKHAVKAGEVLDRVEIEALLAQYAEEGIPMTCPHGRPVMVKMTKLEFEKLFKRVL